MSSDAPTAVATTPKRTLDLDAAKTQSRFVEAFARGLDKLRPDEQTMFLLALGERIRVRAELGELILYQGKPYVTIAGRLRIAHESGRLAGIQPAPASRMERERFGATPDEVLWLCRVWRVGHPHPYHGWGVVSKADRNPVARQYPREVAKKRAMYDALRMAFPPSEDLRAILATDYSAEAEALAAAQSRAALVEPEDMPDETEEDRAPVAETLPAETEEDLLAQDRDLAASEANELPLGTAGARWPRNAIAEGR